MRFVSQILLLPLLLTTVLTHNEHTALRFGDDLSSYIMISPDMSPLEEAVSVCSWIKQLSPTSRRGTWLHYKTIDTHDGITISDNLVYAYLAGGDTPNSQTPAHSQWYHVCLTWDYSSRTRTLYYNGVNIGSATTPSGKKFSVATGSIVLGQHHGRTYKMEANFAGASWTFGGEMANLNILKRKLTDEEVAKMYRSGICSSYEDSLETDIHLSWNTLLSDETEKHGNVEKFHLTCPDHTHEESDIRCYKSWGFLFLPDFYDQEIDTELLHDLRDRLELLAEFTGRQINDALIAQLTKNQCDAV